MVELTDKELFAGLPAAVKDNAPPKPDNWYRPLVYANKIGEELHRLYPQRPQDSPGWTNGTTDTISMLLGRDGVGGGLEAGAKR